MFKADKAKRESEKKDVNATEMELNDFSNRKN